MPGVLSILTRLDDGPPSKKPKSFSSLPDLTVWELPDQEIINLAKETWQSPAPPTPIELVFQFVCKYHNAAHIPLQQGRMKTGNGTTPLLDKAKECNWRQGLQTLLDNKSHGNKHQAPYSEAWHQAILALWGAHSHRSFEALTNKFHQPVASYGGVLPYWTSMLKTSPRMARMALDYLTAPATSVNAERAFSAGRLTINHLQHNMASKTFEAKMAVGLWYGTPLLPGVSEIASVLQEIM